MRKRGKAPKDIFVRKYAQWRRGERLRVGNHKRGADPKAACKRSERQLSFEFH